MDWISPVSGLVGALVGAAASYLGTHRAQAKALADARQARLQAKQDQAVATLAELFSKLQHLVRSLPADWQTAEMDADAFAADAAAHSAWDQELQDLTVSARLAIGVIRDKKLRHRLNEAMSLLEAWDNGLVYAFRRRSREQVLRAVISHAVDCVGAWQREEAAMPEPKSFYLAARESLAIKRDEWEAIAQAAEEDRQRRAAQSARGTAEPTPPAGE